MNRFTSLLKNIALAYFLILIPFVNVTLANDDLKIDLYQNLAEEEGDTNIKFLLGKVMEKSAALQESYGDFSPYGAALFRDGNVKYVWYAKPGQLVNDPALTIPIIRRALQSQAQSGAIVGSAVIYKYKKETLNQLQLNIELEYHTGLSTVFSSEMTLDSNKKVFWGTSSQIHIEPRVFVIDEQLEGEKVVSK